MEERILEPMWCARRDNTVTMIIATLRRHTAAPTDTVVKSRLAHTCVRHEAT